MEMPEKLIACPFCTSNMLENERSEFTGYYRLYVCPSCRAELKQTLAQTPQVKPTQDQLEDCQDCVFGQVNCFDCGDPICESHIRTVEKYAPYFSKELADVLISKYGSRIYCPLCFQNLSKWFSFEATRVGGIKKPPLFNWPLILGTLSLMFIIMIGVKQCSTYSLVSSTSESRHETSQN